MQYMKQQSHNCSADLYGLISGLHGVPRLIPLPDEVLALLMQLPEVLSGTVQLDLGSLQVRAQPHGQTHWLFAGRLAYVRHIRFKLSRGALYSHCSQNHCSMRPRCCQVRLRSTPVCL